jgi:hypothetical protein
MDTDLFLLPASDEAPYDSAEFQAGLEGFRSALRTKSIEARARMWGNPPAHFGSSLGTTWTYTGEFTVALAAVGAPLATILGAWLQARYGRKVRLKVADVEAEARNVEEVEQLLRHAQAFRKKVQKSAERAFRKDERAFRKKVQKSAKPRS